MQRILIAIKIRQQVVCQHPQITQLHLIGYIKTDSATRLDAFNPPTLIPNKIMVSDNTARSIPPPCQSDKQVILFL